MKSVKKVVLFARTTEGKTTHTRPVGVFANTKTALSYKAHLSAAHKSGSADAMKALDPGVKLTEDGKLFADSKWAILEVPYEPIPGASEDESESFEL